MVDKDLLDKMFKTTEDYLHREWTVDIKVDNSGSLWIDGERVCFNFAAKLGPEAIKVEVAMLKAIEKAEDRTKEKMRRK